VIDEAAKRYSERSAHGVIVAAERVMKRVMVPDTITVMESDILAGRAVVTVVLIDS
jgi:hypothetical protein